VRPLWIESNQCNSFRLAEAADSVTRRTPFEFPFSDTKLCNISAGKMVLFNTNPFISGDVEEDRWCDGEVEFVDTSLDVGDKRTRRSTLNIYI